MVQTRVIDYTFRDMRGLFCEFAELRLVLTDDQMRYSGEIGNTYERTALNGSFPVDSQPAWTLKKLTADPKIRELPVYDGTPAIYQNTVEFAIDDEFFPEKSLQTYRPVFSRASTDYTDTITQRLDTAFEAVLADTNTDE